MPAQRSQTEPISASPIDAASLAAFGEAVSAIGTASFDTVLLAAVGRSVLVDSIATVVLLPGFGMRTLGVSSRNDLSAARSRTRDYVALHHTFDPNFDDLVRPRRSVLVRRHDPNRLSSRRYQARFFSKSGAVDKLSYIWWANDIGYYVNFYRLEPGVGYTETDIATLRSLAPLVTSLVAAHGRRLHLRAALNEHDPASLAEAIVSSLSTRLSGRERAVLCRTLLGIRTEGVAIDLGVKPTTVITLRKRAYTKLGIASQAELFSLCLRCLPSKAAEAVAAQRARPCGTRSRRPER